MNWEKLRSPNRVAQKFQNFLLNWQKLVNTAQDQHSPNPSFELMDELGKSYVLSFTIKNEIHLQKIRLFFF